MKDDASLDAVMREHGLGRGAQGYAHKLDVVRTQKGNERAVAARLRGDPRVEYAEPNYLRQPLAVSPRLWALFNPGGLNMRFNEREGRERQADGGGQRLARRRHGVHSAPGGNCYSNTTEEGCVFSSIVAGYTGGNSYRASATGDPIYELNGNLPASNGDHAYMQGTSMAAPNMTSAAAVVAWATGLRGTALRDRLFKTADDNGTAGYDTGYGYGRVNVYRAVYNTATSPR